jgi:hypothetical protein
VISLRRAALIALSLWALSASAHHSHAEFSSELLTVEGELISIAWRNPHPAMVLQVSSQGTDATWHVQVLGNINGLRRTGVTGEIFTVGEQIRITGQVSRRRADLLLATLARLADGSEAVLGPDESTGQAIYRASVPPNTSGSETATTSDRPQGILRVWLVAERSRNPDLPLTNEARAAKEAWDSVTDDPQLGCNPLGMPGAMMSPHPIEFVRRGDDIELRLEEWDARRTIDMTPVSGAAQVSTDRMGYSIGNWEDRTLVVRTGRIDYPWMDEHGTPQSPAVEVIERFTLSVDESSLNYEAVVIDPGTMIEPVVAFTTRWQWVPGETLQPYDCAVLDLPSAVR